MAEVRGFPPVSGPGARILILGSMPSRESLARGQYYAHPRNAFWPIMRALLGLESESYQEQTVEVVRRGVAIWDVLQTCYRPGSLDSAIEDSTIVTNDFTEFFLAHPGIRSVYFNGAKAAEVYRRHVLPQLSGSPSRLDLKRLPSTSPANAGMTFTQKKEAWSVILEPLERS